jgi:zinc transport system permease protein
MNAIYESIRVAVQGLAANGSLPQAFTYQFVINALLCTLLIGPLLGALGTVSYTHLRAHET